MSEQKTNSTAIAGSSPVPCSRPYTPESDKLTATLIVPDSIKSFRKYIKRSLKVCRKLEREMHEWKQHAQREADMRLQLMRARDDARIKAEWDLDAALASKQRLANAITNAAGVLSSENP